MEDDDADDEYDKDNEKRVRMISRMINMLKKMVGMIKKMINIIKR